MHRWAVMKLIVVLGICLHKHRPKRRTRARSPRQQAGINRMVQTSRSRVTNVEPCSIPAKPPTTTKSMFASQRRSISRFSCTTQLTSHSFKL
jgi:hypothetical protein